MIYKDTYMLETVESHHSLLDTLRDWKRKKVKCDDDIFFDPISKA